MCLNDSSCVFVIHFYRNQLNASDSNTNNRKPLNNSPMNTCVLRSQLKIEFGTQKDSSSKIHYLTGIWVLISKLFDSSFYDRRLSE